MKGIINRRIDEMMDMKVYMYNMYTHGNSNIIFRTNVYELAVPVRKKLGKN